MCTDGTGGAAKPTLLVENARTRVTEWRFAKRGDNTGWHRHEYDYIVVPIQDGILEISDAEGNISKSQLKTGVPYFRSAGVEHDVFNGSDGEFAFIEVELLEEPQSHS
ncbi:cupin domain-containing protein [Seohaeicola nanhaiensis]|uniref:Cupin domain-containing protein n=1 Tax=Seohaeicola nanhaiensis TaxID=1387282 RepID=A0ABV9KCG2_9RHOB